MATAEFVSMSILRAGDFEPHDVGGNALEEPSSVHSEGIIPTRMAAFSRTGSHCHAAACDLRQGSRSHVQHRHIRGRPVWIRMPGSPNSSSLRSAFTPPDYPGWVATEVAVFGCSVSCGSRH